MSDREGRYRTIVVDPPWAYDRGFECVDNLTLADLDALNHVGRFEDTA